MAITLTPFLFQTRTLQRLVQSPPALHGVRLLTTSRPCRAPRRTADPIPFELPPELESESPDKKIEDEDTSPDGTITPAERQTFQRIFQEIAERAPRTSRRLPRPLTDQKSPRRGESAINVIIRDAANKVAGKRGGTGEFDPLAPLEDDYSASARDEALLRFPLSLRHAARQALGVSQPQDGLAQDTSSTMQDEFSAAQSVSISDDFPLQEDIDLDALAETHRIETQRRDEKSRVEQLMKTAKTDFELWDVMEREVFPMVEQLGLGQASVDRKSQRAGRRKQSKGQAAVPANAPSPTTLSMEVHGPLYSGFLLYALQLFDQHFTGPSRLSFSILPRVKELGLASYVLGINIPFYNNLMQIYWKRYGDANAVLTLLEEMRHAGVFFDETSLEMVNSIMAFYRLAASGAKGQWHEALMTMPEYEPIVEVKAKHWTNVIRKSIAKRNHDLVA